MTAVLAPEEIGADPVDQADAPDVGADPDPDAPYGVNPRTGQPYKRSPEWRAKLGEALNKGRRTQASARPPKKAAKPRAAAAGAIDYRPGVVALMQIPSVALGVMARWRPVLALDSAAVQLATPALAEAAHQTALVDDRMATVLEKALTAGPYGMLLGALFPLCLQIAANHGLIAVVPEMGILGPEQLLEALKSATS